MPSHEVERRRCKRDPRVSDDVWDEEEDDIVVNQRTRWDCYISSLATI